MVLAISESQDWQYLAEGRVNLLLAYTGQDNYFIGKLLRIRKKSLHLDVSHQTRSFDYHTIPQVEFYQLLGKYVWKESFSKRFSLQMVLEWVVLSDDFIMSNIDQWENERPLWRKMESCLNTNVKEAILMNDATYFHDSIRSLLSIEIKPKWPFEGPIHLYDLKDWGKCYHCLHQICKSTCQKDKNISSIQYKLPSYCPLDFFFSPSFITQNETITQAVRSIIESFPSRHGKLFVGKSFVNTLDIKNNLIVNQSIDSFHNPMPNDSLSNEKIELHREDIIDLVSLILKQESNFILSWKESILQLNTYPLESIKEFYEQLRNMSRLKYFLGQSFQSILKNGNCDDQSFHLDQIASFLLSKTLRDCSFILSIRYICPIQHIRDMKNNNATYVQFKGYLIEYQIQMIDLDEKDFCKIPEYYHTHEDILDMVNNKFDKINLNPYFGRKNCNLNLINK